MLPKKQRVGRSAFSGIQKKGRKVHSKHFSFVFIDNKNTLQLSVVVSKKVIKSATERNKSKRVIYTTVKSYSKNLKSFSGIIYINKNVNTLESLEIKEELHDLFFKAELLISKK